MHEELIAMLLTCGLCEFAQYVYLQTAVGTEVAS